MDAAVANMPPSLPMRLLERGLLPDFLVRFGIRRLLRARLAEEHRGSAEAQQQHLMRLISRLRQSPVAINTAACFIAMAIGVLGMARPAAPSRSAREIGLAGVELRILGGFVVAILLLVVAGSFTYRSSVQLSV